MEREQRGGQRGVHDFGGGSGFPSVGESDVADDRSWAKRASDVYRDSREWIQFAGGFYVQRAAGGGVVQLQSAERDAEWSAGDVDTDGNNDGCQQRAALAARLAKASGVRSVRGDESGADLRGREAAKTGSGDDPVCRFVRLFGDRVRRVILQQQRNGRRESGNACGNNCDFCFRRCERRGRHESCGNPFDYRDAVKIAPRLLSGVKLDRPPPVAEVVQRPLDVG